MWMLAILDLVLAIITFGMGIGFLGMLIKALEAGRYRSEYLVAIPGGVALILTAIRLFMRTNRDLPNQSRAASTKPPDSTASSA
jgi:hypothetical protein